MAGHRLPCLLAGVTALLVACGGGGGGESQGPGTDSAHILPLVFDGIETSLGAYSLHRGLHGEIVAVAELRKAIHPGAAAAITGYEVSVHGLVSSDGGVSWTDMELAQYQTAPQDPSTPTELRFAKNAFHWLSATGPDGVHFSGPQRWLYDAQGQWSELPAVGALLVANPPEAAPKGIKAGGWDIVDLRVDAQGGEHYIITQPFSGGDYYVHLRGAQIESTFLNHHKNSSPQHTYRQVIVGPGETRWVLYERVLSRPSLVISSPQDTYGTFLVPIEADGKEGEAIQLPLQETARAFRGVPLVANWHLRRMKSLVTGGTAHLALLLVATLQRGSEDPQSAVPVVESSSVVLVLRNEGSGWSPPTVVAGCSSEASHPCELGIEGLLPDIDPATGQAQGDAAYLLVARSAEGSDRTVSFARLSDAGPSPLVRSEGLSAVDGSARQAVHQVIGWPRREILYEAKEGFDDFLVYGYTTQVQEGGWPFDHRELLHAVATTPTRIAAWLSGAPDPSTLTSKPCTLDPPLSIEAVEPAPFGAGVVLHTAPQSPGTEYTLSCPGLDTAEELSVAGFPDPAADFTAYPGVAHIEQGWLRVDGRDRIWTIRDGQLIRMDPARLAFQTVRVDPEPPPGPPAHLGAAQIRWIGTDPHDRAWVLRQWPKDGGSEIDRFDGGRWTRFEADLLLPSEGDEIQGLPWQLDHQGGIWVRTPSTLYRIDQLPPSSVDYPADELGRLWGLAAGPDGALYTLTANPDDTRVFEVPEGKRYGLNRLDGTTWTHLDDTGVKLPSGERARLRQIALDSTGRLYAAAELPVDTGATVARGALLWRSATGWQVMADNAPHYALVGPGADGQLRALSTGSPSWAIIELLVVRPDGTTSVSLAPPEKGLRASYLHHTLPFAFDHSGSLWSGGYLDIPVFDPMPVIIRTALSEAAGPSACAASGPRVTLKVTLDAQTGSQGSVQSKPPGIDCPGTCAATFAAGCTVTLRAEATKGRFTGWSGACTGEEACVLRLTEDSAVGATFLMPAGDILASFSSKWVPNDTFGAVEGLSSDTAGAFTALALFQGSMVMEGIEHEATDPHTYGLFLAHWGPDRSLAWSHVLQPTTTTPVARLRTAPGGDPVLALWPGRSGSLDLGFGPLDPPPASISVYLARYAEATGALRFSLSFGSVAVGIGARFDMDVAPDGGIYVAAATNLDGPALPIELAPEISAGPGGFLAAYDPEGSLRWVSAPEVDLQPTRVAALPKGGAVVLARYAHQPEIAGHALPYGGADFSNSDATAVVAYDAQGQLLWARALSEIQPQAGNGTFDALAVTQDGRILVVDSYDHEISVLDSATGALLATWDHGDALRGGLALGPGGAIALTGAENNAPAGSLATVLEPDGSLRWSRTIPTARPLSVQGAAWIDGGLAVGLRGPFTIPGLPAPTAPPGGLTYTLAILRAP